MKNKRIKAAMNQAGINQTQLAEVLGISNTETTYMLKRELAVREQNEIVKRIREWSALNQNRKEEVS